MFVCGDGCSLDISIGGGIGGGTHTKFGRDDGDVRARCGLTLESSRNLLIANE